jgi:hypothetical protein
MEIWLRGLRQRFAKPSVILKVARWFESNYLRQSLSVCNVSLVDGLVWNEEAVGSNPTTQTSLCSVRLSV